MTVNSYLFETLAFSSLYLLCVLSILYLQPLHLSSTCFASVENASLRRLAISSHAVSQARTEQPLWPMQGRGVSLASGRVPYCTIKKSVIKYKLLLRCRDSSKCVLNSNVYFLSFNQNFTPLYKCGCQF